MMRMVLGAAAFWAFGFLAGETLSTPARIVTRSIDNAREWQAIASQWKENSDRFEAFAHRFEAVALDFRRQSIQLQDSLMVCTSMLPPPPAVDDKGL